jgi:hypothetical protein
MDRDLGMPKKESGKHDAMCWVCACASRFADETNWPTHAWYATQRPASSKAHDKDGTFNKEFHL